MCLLCKGFLFPSPICSSRVVCWFDVWTCFSSRSDFLPTFEGGCSYLHFLTTAFSSYLRFDLFACDRFRFMTLCVSVCVAPGDKDCYWLLWHKPACPTLHVVVVGHLKRTVCLSAFLFFLWLFVRQTFYLRGCGWLCGVLQKKKNWSTSSMQLSKSLTRNI